MTEAAQNLAWIVSPFVELVYGLPSRNAQRDDAGLIAYAIQFAEGREEAAPPITQEVIARELAPSGRAPADPGLIAFSGVTDEQRAAERERLMRLLDTVLSLATSSLVDHRRRLSTIYDTVRAAAPQVQWRHLLERAPDGIRWRHQAIIDNCEAFYVLITAALLDHREELCRCNHCGHFFLARKRRQHEGRTERLYCSRGHRLAAHEAGAAARQRAVRARKPLDRRYGQERAAAAVRRVMSEHPGVATVSKITDLARAVLENERRAK